MNLQLCSRESLQLWYRPQVLQTSSSLSRLQPGFPPHTSHPTLFSPPSHCLLYATPSPLVPNTISLPYCKHSTPLHFSPLISPKNLALPHQDTFVTPVNSKPVFQSLDVLKSPTERDLTCIPSTAVIDLEQEHTSNPSSRVPTLTKTAHAPLLPTTSFPECGHPNRLPSAVQGSLRAGPLPTVEAAAPPTTTSKLCLLPPVLARVGYIFTRARLYPPSPVPPARQHRRQSVPPCRSDARPSPGPRGRPHPDPARTCGPAPPSPHSPRIGLLRHGAASLGAPRLARPAAEGAAGGPAARSHGGRALGLRRDSDGPRSLGPGAGRAPRSASSAAAAAAAPLRLQTQHGGGGGAENKGPGRANGSSGPRSVRAGPRERRARTAAAAAGGHGRRRRQRLRGALGGEARPLGAHPPREEGTGGGEPGPRVTCPKHAHVTLAPRPSCAAHARSARPGSRPSLAAAAC